MIIKMNCITMITKFKNNWNQVKNLLIFCYYILIFKLLIKKKNLAPIDMILDVE